MGSDQRVFAVFEEGKEVVAGAIGFNIPNDGRRDPVYRELGFGSIHVSILVKLI